MEVLIILVLVGIIIFCLFRPNDYFRRLVEAGPEGIWVINTQGITTYVNPHMVNLLGYARHEMMGQSIYKFMEKEAQVKPPNYLEGLLGRHDFRLRHKNGTLIWVMVATNFLKNRQGKTIGALAILKDITERKHLEAALHRNRAYYQAIVDYQKDLICRYTPQGKLTFVNQAYCDFHGKSAIELIGTSVFDLATAELRPHIADLVANPRVIYSDWQGPDAQGQDCWLRWCDQAIFDEDNQIVEIQSVGQDITDSYHSQQNLANQTKQLEATNRELEAFTYSVSHDLRAPLRAIAGFSRVLMVEYKEALPEQGNHYLQRIHKNATQMGTLIDDLLNLSRLGRQPLAQKEVDFNHIVQEIIHEGRDAKDIPPEINFEVEELPKAWGDPHLLKQVFVNFITNAVKFSRDSNPPKVKISYTRQDGEIVYSVTDNGVGFNMAYADKLFGVFQTLHSRQDFEGTGIGLAIVHRIITKHGGQVWAESIEGQGATFFFSLSEKRTQNGNPVD